jgi:hypothetical protein
MLLYLTSNICKEDDSPYSSSHLSHIKSAFVSFHKEGKFALPLETEPCMEDFIISIKKMRTQVNSNRLLKYIIGTKKYIL